MEGIGPRIETLVKLCLTCQGVKSSPALAHLHPWVWLNGPWRQIHINFVDHSWQDVFNHCGYPFKWPEVIVMPITSQITIETLQMLFLDGLLEQVVSDNGPQFTSEKFAQFMQGNGIKHILCVPNHPASNVKVVRFISACHTGHSVH